jgi:micrococcal nuclease
MRSRRSPGRGFIPRKLLIALVPLVLLIGAYLGLDLRPDAGEVASAPPLPGRISKVVDGDTVEVDLGEGLREKVRYLLIDTPELHHPKRGEEELGRAAYLKNREMALGRRVRLETDLVSRDKYGRLLAYVWIRGDDGVEFMANERMIREGYAMPMTIPPNVRYVGRISRAFREARSADRGLWGAAEKRLFTPAAAWNELPYLKGRFITLEIRPTRLIDSKSTFRLVQGKIPMAVLIYRNCAKPFGDLNRLVGRRLRIMGKVTAGHRGAELILADPLQIFGNP